MSQKQLFRYKCHGSVQDAYALSNVNTKYKFQCIDAVCVEMTDGSEEYDIVEINVFSTDDLSVLFDIIELFGLHVEVEDVLPCETTNIIDEVDRLGLSYLEILT